MLHLRLLQTKMLSNNTIDEIIAFLIKGRQLPNDYRDALISQLNNLKHSILFDTKKKYELIYADKEREEDILADTMAVPLQKVKTFLNGKNGNGWTNMLIFGDNLQVLKTLLQKKEKGKFKNADGTPGVRLILIRHLEQVMNIVSAREHQLILLKQWERSL